MVREINPFQVSGPVRPEDMIDRDGEAENLFALADGGHSARLVAPRRYGKTTLLGRVLRQAGEVGLPTALVDLHGVLTMGAIVVRIERAYAARLKGPIRRAADALLRSWNVGLSLGGGGFTALLQSNPKVDAESVLLRLLDLPTKLAEKTGKRSVIAFDEIQDLLRVEGADGVIRSVIQHQVEDASYIFAGSAPSLMRRLFEDPSRPLLEHALPIELAPLVQPEYEGQVFSDLADGRRIREESYWVTVPFDGAIVRVTATFAPVDEILIGTRLLRGHRLEISFSRQTVLIEREDFTADAV